MKELAITHNAAGESINRVSSSKLLPLACKILKAMRQRGITGGVSTEDLLSGLAARRMDNADRDPAYMRQLRRDATVTTQLSKLRQRAADRHLCRQRPRAFKGLTVH